MIEAIPDEDSVSRLIDSPFRFNRAEQAYVDENLWQFPKNDRGPESEREAESVVWRRYAQQIDDVHAIGCAQQLRKRTAAKPKPDYTYEGAITQTAQTVRSITTDEGHGFSVVHVPLEGAPYHTHIKILKAPGQLFDRTHKIALIESLHRTFGQREAHVCPEHT